MNMIATKPRLLLLTFAVLSLGLVVWWLTRPMLAPNKGQLSGTRLSAEQHKHQTVARWSGLKMQPLAAFAETKPEIMSQLLADRVEGAPQLVAVYRNGFAAAVAASLRCRAMEASELVRSAAEDPTTRWAVPADNAWKTIDMWFEYTTGRAKSTGSAESLFAEFVTNDYEQRGFRLDAAELTSAGTKLLLFTVRTPEQVWLECDRLLGAELDAWVRGENARAVTFRVPKTTLEAVLQRDRIATVGASWVVVQAKGGAPFLWECSWFYEPQSKQWVREKVSRRGWTGKVFY